MIKGKVPQILGKIRVNAYKCREKVGLEYLDDTFSGVATMGIQRDKLKLDVPLLLDDALVVIIGFIVEDL